MTSRRRCSRHTNPDSTTVRTLLTLVIAADNKAVIIAAAPAIGSHVGVTRGGGEADLEAPHSKGMSTCTSRDVTGTSPVYVRFRTPGAI